MNIFHARFSASQTIKATGVTSDNLQNWIKRQLIIGQKDKGIEGGGSQGRHRQFSFNNLIEIAAANALIEAGMGGPAGGLKAVFNAANMFAHTGSGPIGETPERIPGCPFNKAPGITLLVAGPDWSEEVFMSPDDTALKLYTDLLFRAQGKREGCVFVNMNDVFDRVVTGAGYHPEAVMELAYS